MSNDELVALIREAIQLAISVQNDTTLVPEYPALDYVINELRIMERNVILNNVRKKIGLGRVVVDSWPLSAPLGMMVIEVEQAYLSTKK